MNATMTMPLSFVPRMLSRRPAVVAAATAATGFLRQMALKPYVPARRSRELDLAARNTGCSAVRNTILREGGSGDTPTIVIGGFVPDATEAVEFQRELFRDYGDIYYINYSRRGFSREMFFAQLGDLVEDLNSQGENPVIFGVSFGCGLLSGFLRSSWCHSSLRIRGIVMTSPVLCLGDLVRPVRGKGEGVRMLESNLKKILHSAAEEVERHIDRARRCFLALFETGAEQRVLTRRHLSIRKKIGEMMTKTSALGGYERVLAMKEFALPQGREQIFAGPALILISEREEDILVPTSPTLDALRDEVKRKAIFPKGNVRSVSAGNPADPVAHASLIFHHHCYNPMIEAWYDRVQPVRLFKAV